MTNPCFPGDGFEPTMQLRIVERKKYPLNLHVPQQLWTRSDGTWEWRDIPIVNEEKP